MALKRLSRMRLPRRHVTAVGMSHAERQQLYQAANQLLERGRSGATNALPQSEFSVQSQNGEDGILAEIFARIDPRSRFFVEFGVGSGCEGNCVFLADWCAWRGLFIESNVNDYARLSRKYAPVAGIETRNALVTAANINELLANANVPSEIDVISIDVDGADYWIWSAIEDVAARVVVIEYNSALDAAQRLVQPPSRTAWNETSAFGASIAALQYLAKRKGYTLAHTDLAGVNAFFIRNDLAHLFPESLQPVIHGTNHSLQSAGHRPGSIDNFIDPAKAE